MARVHARRGPPPAAIAPLLIASLVAFAALLPPAGPGSAAAACLPARQLFAVREIGRVALRQPADLVLADDRLYVLDDLNGRVAVLDLQGRGVGSVPLPGPEGGAWLGIGYGGADQLFLGSSGDGHVAVVDLKGKLVREFKTADGAEKAGAAGVLVSPGGCFVADNRAHRVRAFTLEGKQQAAWGSLGEGETQFRAPFRLAQDSLGRVLVSDSLNSRVLAFTPKGEPLAGFGEFGTS